MVTFHTPYQRAETASRITSRRMRCTVLIEVVILTMFLYSVLRNLYTNNAT